jgi:hypothetical protein
MYSSEDLKICLRDLCTERFEIALSVKELFFEKIMACPNLYRMLGELQSDIAREVFNHKELFSYKWNSLEPQNKVNFISDLLFSFSTNMSRYQSLNSVEDFISLKNFYDSFFESVFDKTEGYEKDYLIQDMRAKICKIIPTRSICFKTKYSQYLQEPVVLSHWTELGMIHSNDISFFELIWKNIDYKKGFVEERKKLIDVCFRNCDDLPEQIIKDCTERGHSSVKFYIIKVICSRINMLRCSQSRSGLENHQIQYYSDLLGKFIQNADYHSMQYLIPFLTKEQLFFAGSLAVNLGLTKQVEKALMKFEKI